ncbi:MAG: hypothetical protein U0V73_13920 [Acidimicrobiia bacterium]
MPEPLHVLVVQRQRDVRRHDELAGRPSSERGHWGERLAARIEREVAGPQMHVEYVRRYLEGRGDTVEVLTPFDVPWVMPVAGATFGKVAGLFGAAAREAWRRCWHVALLRLALHRWDRRRGPANRLVVYAQCPLAAYAAQRSGPDGAALALAIH